MGAPAALPEEVAARRQRFIEAGGIEPTSAADRALFEALLASGSFLPDLPPLTVLEVKVLPPMVPTLRTGRGGTLGIGLF